MEEAYVNFLSINQKCPLQRLQLSGQQLDVLPRVKALSLADRAMFDRGMRAFVSFVQAYAKHECSLIFRIKDLDLARLARGFALLRMPKMPELKGKTFPGFTRTPLDTDAIRYKDKQREKLRQKMLLERQEKLKEPPPPRRSFIKNKSWSKQTTKKERRRKRSAKRKLEEGSDVEDEDMKELLDDTRLLKRLKKGKISKEDFEKQMASESGAEEA
ncbi:ATP-dependent RNA helicase DDX55 [Liparis tanakae]|uniref:ATP-dependent RNA helicase DDX55 n=1 Tax=Liparis tanakae TaxID=230148 RepID=A0A4Z2EH73_9TELE|nr:ATP-dependent RNA helicase DDX55 [Liparis tanakae]